MSGLSRLGRSMLECIEILSIATEKGLHIYAAKGNWQLDGSIQSKIIAMAFAIAAERAASPHDQRTSAPNHTTGVLRDYPAPAQCAREVRDCAAHDPATSPSARRRGARLREAVLLVGASSRSPRAPR